LQPCCIADVVWVAVAEFVAAAAHSVGVVVVDVVADVVVDVVGVAGTAVVDVAAAAVVVAVLLAVWARLWVHIAKIVQLPIAQRNIPIRLFQDEVEEEGQVVDIVEVVVVVPS